MMIRKRTRLKIEAQRGKLAKKTGRTADSGYGKQLFPNQIPSGTALTIILITRQNAHQLGSSQTVEQISLLPRSPPVSPNTNPHHCRYHRQPMQGLTERAGRQQP